MALLPRGSGCYGSIVKKHRADPVLLDEITALEERFRQLGFTVPKRYRGSNRFWTYYERMRRLAVSDKWGHNNYWPLRAIYVAEKLGRNP